MVHLGQRNHKTSMRKQSGLHLRTWLSPKNTKNPIKTEKSKFQKSFLSVTRYPIDTQVYQISYKSDQNCNSQAGEKFHQTDTRQTDTHTTENFYCSFLVLGVQNVEKKIQLNLKNKNFRDCSNICLPGPGTYKNQ